MTRQHCIMGYLSSDSLRAEGTQHLTIEKLQPAVSILTHLIYGPCSINFSSNQVTPAHPDDLDTESQEGMFRQITGLKAKNPHLKVLLSIGRREYDEARSEKYVNFLENEKARAEFIENMIHMAKKYDFDGIDLAWEFPRYKKNPILSFISNVLGAGENKIKSNFTTLIREMKGKLGNLILTLTALPNQKYIDDFYDVTALMPNVNFVILSTYDFCAPKESPNIADYSAPLYTPKNRKQSVDTSVTKWHAAGAQDNKLVIGIPCFGRSWVLGTNLVQFKSVKVEAQEPPFNATSPAPAAKRSGLTGLVSLVEARERLPNPENAHLTGSDAALQEFTNHVHTHGNYAINTTINGGDFISYESPESASHKAAYVLEKGLAGVTMFNIEYDDFNGEKYVVKFPLMNAVEKEFRQ